MPAASQGRSGRGAGGAVAAGEGHGVNASPAGPRRWPGGRDKEEEEEEEVSRLRAGEPRRPAGEAGSAAPPLSGARLAGPRGAEFPEERRWRRRRGRGEPGEGGAEGREGGALPGRKRCTPLLPSALRPERGTHFSFARWPFAYFIFLVSARRACRLPGSQSAAACAAGEDRVLRGTLAREEGRPGSRGLPK